MADDDSPRPFRRERNLSNRNFARRGSRRRFSTESHSSLDSYSTTHDNSESLLSAATTTTTTTTNSSSDATTTTTTSGSLNLNSNSKSSSSSSSSSMQISYSVNSDTEGAFNRKSIRKMKPMAPTNAENGAAAAAAANGDTPEACQTPEAPETPETPDPAMLDVKQKVLRFETLQSEEQILFKTGKFQWRCPPNLQTTPLAGRATLGPLRVLPLFARRQSNGESGAGASSLPTSSRAAVTSFHTSIDEEHTEDEIDDFSDYVEDEVDNADDNKTNDPDADDDDTSAVYEIPEEAKELQETTIPSPTPGFESPNNNLVDAFNSNALEFGIDDFGKVEAVRTSSKSEQLEIPADTTSIPPEVVKREPKDFPRNYRSAPRRKTEVIGAKNRQLIGKFNSVYQPTDDTGDESEELIVLRDKSDSCVNPILEELIKTEETYVENLLVGIRNYGNIFHREDIPIGLRGKKYVLLGNIEQIAEFHRDEFLPMLHRNRRDLKRLFDEFIQFIDQNCFYGYVIFTMNKKRSLELCDVYKNYFKHLQNELDDKLGINSFLVQPIQRMARYPLLLNEFITTLFKNHQVVMKQLIESCCRLEKKVRTLLKVTNESEVINDIVDCNEFNVFYQGKFRKVSEFSVFDHTLKRTYRSKVFIFDKCILYTEIKGKHLIFHGRYPCEHIGIVAKTKSFTLYYEQRKKQECDFNGDPQLIEMWLELIREMINSYVTMERKNLQERYSRESDHLHRKPPSLSLYRDSNRFSSDSGIGNIWVMPRPEVEDASSNRTTWYAIS